MSALSPNLLEDPQTFSQRLLFPLNELTDVAALKPTTVDASAMPEPYRRLLVHDRDMTSTLEAFHGERSRLRPLVQELRDGGLWRKVVLVGIDTGAAQEFGAIRIDLGLFSAAARREIIAGQRPLGAILARFDLSYVSQPRQFFSLDADAELARYFAVAEGLRLFGRQNVLSTPQGALAEVVEILPPTRPRGASSKLEA